MKLTTYILILFCIVACEAGKKTEIPVAQVFESCLYRQEIADFIPQETGYSDSILMAQSYVRKWITHKLLLHKAIENLSAEESNIRKQVEDYRTSLLIHNYKQKLISQRQMEEVTSQEIADYYEKHKNNFILATPIVRAVFFVLPKNAPKLDEARKMYRSDDEASRESLEDYCLCNARKYDKFEDNWIEAKFLLNLIPGDFNTLEKEILSSKFIEKEDDENCYFLKIREMKREQTQAPLDYVRDEIILILKNKKTLKFENQLEKEINEEAKRKNYVKIY